MITAIIPCYNAAAYLGEAIESVLRQTRPVDEVIVVDDCSTDDSVAIAGQFDVRLLSTPENLGHAAARNLAIQESQGEVIAWLDADDYWNRNHIETVVGLLDENPDAAVACSGVRFFGARQGEWKPELTEMGRMEQFWTCFQQTMVPAMSAVTRTEPLRVIGGFDGSLRSAPDFDLWLRLARQSRFVSTQDVTSNYRWHSSQISADPSRQRESIYRSRAKMLNQLALEEEAYLVEQGREELRKIWNADLQCAWFRSNRADLKSVLALREYVGVETELSKMLQKRLRIPFWPSKYWSILSQVLALVSKKDTSKVSVSNP